LKERMQAVWDRVREKEALAAAGLALCAEPGGFWPAPKLWISVACGLIVTLTPLVSAAKGM